MPKATMRKQIVDDFDRLSPELQERARDLVRGLVVTRPKGTTVDELMPLIGVLDEDSARQMMEAVAAGCEQVNHDER